MNKSGFIKELSKQTGYEEEKCIIINDIIEETALIGKKSKEEMIEGFKEKLNLDETSANELYEKAMGIIAEQIKNKLKHPFKSQD